MRTFLLLFLIAACLPAAAQPSRVAVRTSPALGHTALLVRPAAEASTLRLQVYRHDGTLRFETTLPHHPDDPLPHLAPADGDGDVVYTLPGTAEVVFLAPDGALRRRATLFDAAPYDLERNVLVAWRPDGRAVAVVAQRVPDGPGVDTDARLFLFDRDGTLRWQRPLPGPALAALAFGVDGRVAVDTYDAYARAAVVRRRHVFTPAGEPTVDAPAEGFDFDAGGVQLVAKWTSEVLPGGGDPGGDSRPAERAGAAEAQYPWPATPFHESHEITGTFSEYRDTAPAPHFHDGVDVPKPTARDKDVLAIAQGAAETNISAVVRDAEARQAMSGTMATGESLGKIPVPALVLKADASPEVRQANDEAARVIQKGRLVHIDGAGHNLHHDDLDRTVEVLTEFLSDL